MRLSTLTVKNITIGEGKPKICISLTGKNSDELIAQIKNMDGHPIDIVEWRADFFTHSDDLHCLLDMAKTLRSLLPSMPLIFTFRSLNEGGEREISPHYYHQINSAICHSTLIDFIDIELQYGNHKVSDLIDIARHHQVNTILSHHNFIHTPSETEIICCLTHMIELGADIAKIAVMPKKLDDLLILLSATEKINQLTQHPIIAISMGQLGMLSRIVGEIFGSVITFSLIDKSSAPGQIPVDDINTLITIIHRHQVLQHRDKE